MKKKQNVKYHLKTAQIVAMGFAGVILLGGLLLSIPATWAPGHQIKFIDALFTSATSICVTGLVTVSTYEAWSGLGHLIILLLIQLGGLGVIICGTLVILALGKRISIRNRKLIRESFNLDSSKNLIKLVKKIVAGTLAVEGTGAILYSIHFIPEFGLKRGIQVSVFNAVSAFCNAGMDIIGNNSLADYVENPLINFTTMGLIVLGGLGYLVWWDVLKCFRRIFKEKEKVRLAFRKLELNTKIVLVTTGVLIFGGGLLILILEYDNPGTLGTMSFGNKCMAAVFQSVTCRTAGFLTIPQENIKASAAMVCMILMFIGGSPVGTAGGVKTTTVAAVILSGISFAGGKQETEAFKRQIPESNIKTAGVVILMGMSVFLISTIGLSAAVEGMEQGFTLMDVMYETVSAGATVGLSRGMTGLLPAAGKIIVMLTMYIGRIGPTTLAAALAVKEAGRPAGMHLPQEKIFIG